MTKLYQTAKFIYKTKYAVLNVAIFIIYYVVFNIMLLAQDGALPELVIPQYEVYALLATASIALTLSIYAIRNTRRNYAKITASSASITTTLIGGIISGCGCSSPIIFAMFSALGATSAAVPIYIFFVNYSTQIFPGIITLNLIIIVYYLNRFSKPECKIQKVHRHPTKKG